MRLPLGGPDESVDLRTARQLTPLDEARLAARHRITVRQITESGRLQELRCWDRARAFALELLRRHHAAAAALAPEERAAREMVRRAARNHLAKVADAEAKAREEAEEQRERERAAAREMPQVLAERELSRARGLLWTASCRLRQRGERRADAAALCGVLAMHERQLMAATDAASEFCELVRQRVADPLAPAEADARSRLDHRQELERDGVWLSYRELVRYHAGVLEDTAHLQGMERVSFERAEALERRNTQQTEGIERTDLLHQCEAAARIAQVTLQGFRKRVVLLGDSERDRRQWVVDDWHYDRQRLWGAVEAEAHDELLGGERAAAAGLAARAAALLRLGVTNREWHRQLAAARREQAHGRFLLEWEEQALRAEVAPRRQ
eukprot:TRINITY_DN14776_c0_g1_i1.p1 TRINITY_DN14776_c0_g1~~TRINITY_DN14776_c0_g1_i1.p1  ORF type:complete len:383 (+),score=156.16 TRINITY_DN14776_c0_g1_i1:79-1227(+)